MNLPVEEYYDVAAIGLCRAAIKYDGSTKFSTYAFICMKTDVYREFTKMKTGSRIPVELICSLDVDKTTDDNSINYFELIPSNSNTEDEVVTKLDFEQFLEKVPDREREIFTMRQEGFTQREIAKKFQLSQPTVQRLMKKSIQYFYRD